MRLPALLLSLALLPGPALHLSMLQEGQKAVDERPEVKALVDEIDPLLKAKGEKDKEAIEVLDKLVQEFPNCGPKDRLAIVKVCSDCFDLKRTKELEEGVPDDRLYRAAAVSMGLMGPESVKPLMALIGDKSHRKNQGLQIALTQSLGKTKSPDAVKTLTSLLKHKDAPMQAAGAEALAYYSDAPDALQTEIDEGGPVQRVGHGTAHVVGVGFGVADDRRARLAALPALLAPGRRRCAGALRVPGVRGPAAPRARRGRPPDARCSRPHRARPAAAAGPGADGGAGLCRRRCRGHLPARARARPRRGATG